MNKIYITPNHDPASRLSLHTSNYAYIFLLAFLLFIPLYSVKSQVSDETLKKSNRALADVTAPSLSPIMLSSQQWLLDGITPYKITATADDDQSGVNEIRIILNHQGSNIGNRRGYFAWKKTGYTWGTAHSTDRMSCKGGGYALKYNGDNGVPIGYGKQFVKLVDCSTSIKNNTRKVTFVVQPLTTFGEFNNNDISLWAGDLALNQTNWINNDLNFISEKAETLQPLFSEQSNTSFGGELGLIRNRTVNINSSVYNNILRPSGSKALSTDRLRIPAFILNLFDDTSVTFIPEKSSKSSTGSMQIQGKVEGNDSSQVALVMGQHSMAGSIRVNGEVFEVVYQSSRGKLISPSTQLGIHNIRQVDGNVMPGDTVMNIPGANNSTGNGSDDGSVIDILIGYTTDARIEQGGVEPMNNLINLAILENNIAYVNSGINTRLRLVHTVEVENGNTTGINFPALVNDDDGVWDELHVLRDQHAADLVSVVVKEDPNFCGFAAGAFNMVIARCMIPRMVLAHEIGHNLGADHHDGQFGAFPYSKGYIEPGNRFGTIMTNIDLIPFFSGLTGVYFDPTTQIAHVTGTAERDNARTMNERAYDVANFRNAPIPPPQFADLTIDILEGSFPVPPRAHQFSLYYNVVNIGNAAAESSTVKYYVSNDQFLGSGDIVLNQHTDIASIAAGSLVNKVVTINIPEHIIGNKYLLVVADAFNDVDEDDQEGNNVSALAIELFEGPPDVPDLIISNTSNPSEVMRGSAFTVSYDVVNIGEGPNATADSSFSVVMLSTDNIPINGNDSVIGVGDVPALSAGTSSSQTLSVSIPEETPAGHYYLIYRADSAGTIQELIEANNFVVVPIEVQRESCAASNQTMCLQNGRFSVTLDWVNHHGGGGSGQGQVANFSDQTGFFYFFNSQNIEVIVKILDGTTSNGHWWVFYGGLTDLAYTLTVEDHELRQIQTYQKPVGSLCGDADTFAFDESQGNAALVTMQDSFNSIIASGKSPWHKIALPAIKDDIELRSASCVPSQTALCLHNNRFKVEIDWRTNNGNTGTGKTIPFTDQSGFFWFFNPGNLEIGIKVLNGGPVNGHWWVFFGSLSNVEFTITVTDTMTGETSSYFNPQSTYCGQADTQAFAQ